MHTPKPTAGDTSWFTHDRFGMFIHWGLYSQAARHEWVQHREEIHPDSYRKYFDHFDPDRYDPALWAAYAREAGMKYVVLTTKHHEGFCLWDSAHTDYKATNTPAGRDLLKPFVDAFRAEGLRVGFYYSLIDWHHPDFPIDHIHPLRNHPDATEMNESRDVSKYRTYLHAQVEELLTAYKPDIMWFDFSYRQSPKYPHFQGKGADAWGSVELMQKIRSICPDIIVNDRLEIGGDVITPEQYQPTSWVTRDGEPVVWEACQTFSGSWGYHRDESSWKTPEQLIQLLVNSVANGGNLLLNVGPTARGNFDDRAVDALAEIAEWMELNARSIYGCTASPLTPPPDCRYTTRDNRLYVHVFNWPFTHLHLPGLAGKIGYAQLLHDASEVHWAEPKQSFGHGNMLVEQANDTIVLKLPVEPPPVRCPVIELFLKEQGGKKYV